MQHHIQQLTKALKSGHHVALLTHRKPDGDAWGAMIALSAICNHFGRPATWYSPDHLTNPWPELTLSTNADHLRRADVVIVADCSDWHLTGWDRNQIHPNATILNIDHHSSNSYFGHYNWVEDRRSSVCEMLVELLSTMDFGISPSVLLALTLGILSDTGNFTNSATTSSSLRACAHLLRQGVSWSTAFHQLWQDHDHRVLAVWGRAFQRLTLDHATNGAHTFLHPGDLAHLPPNVATATTDGLANFLNHLQGPAFVMVACDRGNDCKISFRTNKPEVDVRAIAALFGGGGHIKAAGCTVPTTGPMDQLLPQLLAQIPRAG